MRVIRIQAEQAHAFPSMVMKARGPFEVYQPSVIVEDYQPEFPPGATAQNGMTEVAMFECSQCMAVVRGDALDSHQCEE
jgi:hypothetical protein